MLNKTGSASGSNAVATYRAGEFSSRLNVRFDVKTGAPFTFVTFTIKVRVEDPPLLSFARNSTV